MNKMLEEQTLKLYSNHGVDAVINVTQRTDPDGDVFASGLAIHFVEPPKPASASIASTRSMEDRLRELLDLREKGLITPEEYYEKRVEILGEL